MSIVGPDIVLRAPEDELIERAVGLEANAARRRRRPKFELPELDEGFYAGFSHLVVRTALVRADTWRKDSPRPLVTQPNVIAQLCRHAAAYDQEHIMTVSVNSAGEAIAVHETSIGTTSASYTTGQHVMKVAFLTGAKALAIVHNHPSGNPTPSRDDAVMFALVEHAGTILGIDVLDSIVVARRGWSSLHAGEVYTWSGELQSLVPHDDTQTLAAERRKYNALGIGREP